MKKFLSMAVALVMVLSLTCVAFADVSVDVSGIDTASSWDTYGASYEDDSMVISLDDMNAIVEALSEDGSQLVYTITNTAGWFQVGFNADTAAYSNSGDPDGESGYVAYTVEADGDNQKVTVDGKAVYDLITASDWYQLICGGEVLLNVTVVSAGSETAAVEAEEAEAAEETEEASEEAAEAAEETTEAAAEETTTSPATGVALALVPMAIAGIAVVGSKRR
ncbi:MAG: hypothetical protein LUC38_03735 [Oscillospiraceae bacterium]|nr:hypothetical protein [Ruminococcus sp.]MCD8345055.1 hypothetical protein [Oscillospiraceae bacterium]